MNCKNCEYGLKQSCGDFEKIICTYEEGECIKITQLEAQIENLVYLHKEDINTIKLLNKQIEKMKCCGNCVHCNTYITSCIPQKHFVSLEEVCEDFELRR